MTVPNERSDRPASVQTLEQRAEVLRLLRLRAGLSQKQLADTSGLSQSIVSKAENGIGQMEATTLRALALALGVSADVIIGLSPVPPPDDESKGIAADPYPHRRLLRQSSEYANAPDDVRRYILSLRNNEGDRTLTGWLEELRFAAILHEKGQLGAVLRGEAGTPAPRRKRP